ncbi:hypothetical protein [Macrococcus equipercicus]|uniref:Uncharacterized protein n=1 Tax=Macrococcus equipercicus TaxID=69967 RepID=A0A9Q9BQG6_9STAP|nr:hypothetical protein [Macrococcus equipercicus]KAA1039502.1 hypothetical protein ERX35_005330 [Macrococcus equipercicus]UTH13786.1 hypothetical protein KFV11_11375 [Macrococcus equipercicus]
MQPLKRIIYGIKVITKSDDKKEKMYHVTYYYFVQAVLPDEHVTLNEDIYDKISYAATAIRYLDIISCDEIEPGDSDYHLYDYLYRTKDTKLFHVKDMVVYKLNEVLY